MPEGNEPPTAVALPPSFSSIVGLSGDAILTGRAATVAGADEKQLVAPLFIVTDRLQAIGLVPLPILHVVEATWVLVARQRGRRGTERRFLDRRADTAQLDGAIPGGHAFVPNLPLSPRIGLLRGIFAAGTENQHDPSSRDKEREIPLSSIPAHAGRNGSPGIPT